MRSAMMVAVFVGLWVAAAMPVLAQPTPAGPVPGQPPGTRPGKYVLDAPLASEYGMLFETMKLRPERLESIDVVIAKINAEPRKSLYLEVEKATGVPWYVVAILHEAESGANLRTHLINGDPLTARTANVPAGRPVQGEPPFTWSASAIDAMTFEGFAGQKDWELERILYRLEKFNGFGYRKRGFRSPYLWSGSNHYEKGKFVADMVYDPEAVTKIPGAASILKRLIDKGLIAAPSRLAASGGPVQIVPDKEEPVRRIALIVGNGKYPDGIAPLKNAEADADDIAAAFKSKGYTIFGHPEKNLTRDQMFTAIKAFEEAAKSADVAVAWYAGHGHEFPISESESGNFLIPADFAPGDDVIQKGLPLKRLITSVTFARRLRVVVVDACRNSGLGSGERGSERGFQPEPRSNVLVVYSTRPGQTASDGNGRNSPFAKAFLKLFPANAKIDVRKFFGGVAGETFDETKGKQEPEKIDRLRTFDDLPLAE